MILFIEGCEGCAHKDVCKYCDKFSCEIEKLSAINSNENDILRTTVECTYYEPN